MYKQYKLECPSCEEGYINLNDESFDDELPCEICGEPLNINSTLQELAEEFLEDGF